MYPRKPYDPDEPRVPLYEDNREPDPDYKSIQKSINSGPGGTISRPILEKYLEKLKKRGFTRIPIGDVYEVKNGSRIAYVTKDNKWRSGGFLLGVKNSNTVYDSDVKLDTYKIYISYKSFNNALFNVQEDDIRELWVKTFGQNKDSGPIIISEPTAATSYPITAPDKNGKPVVIKFSRDEFDRQRFLASMKYARIIKNGWTFEDGSQKLELLL
jgi:hypothetical protein